MALKPTIYKFALNIVNLNQDYYETHNLTVAQHPSETVERMMARVLAFSLNAQQALTFTKGLSAVDEPDLWAHSLDGQMALWLDVGEPAYDRIKKATRLADSVLVYCFNSKAGVWWQQNHEQFSALKVQVVQFDWPHIQAFARLLQRSTELTVTIDGNNAFINSADGDCEVAWQTLQN